MESGKERMEALDKILERFHPTEQFPGGIPPVNA